jgi:predicted CoA-substrate-specific enzyme activase
MITAGVDVGSLTAKAMVWDTDQGRALGQALLGGTADPGVAGRRVLAQALAAAGVTEGEVCCSVGTGYGRVALGFVSRRLTEITCHSRGVHHLLPQVRTVIDIGGQDSKVIRSDEAGRALDFEMNDRCAAGTGRFLEVMASALGTDLSGLGELARRAASPARISSTCTVFAESEVIGLLAQGVDRAAIAAGLCQAVAQRIAAMVWRLGLEAPVALTGGVALNEPVRQALQDVLGTGLLVPKSPQMTGALGAALLAAEGVETSL